MSESSITIRTYRCDGTRCTMEDEVKDGYRPPAGWLALVTYTADNSKTKHLCPECAKDLSEVFPVK